MKFVLHVIKLFEITPEFQGCIVIQYPAGGDIVDYVTIDNSAFILVRAEVDAPSLYAHFHALHPDTPIYTDSFEYVHTYQFDKTIVPVGRIPVGDFGIHSRDYIAEHGDDASKRNHDRLRQLVQEYQEKQNEAREDIPTEAISEDTLDTPDAETEAYFKSLFKEDTPDNEDG